MTNTIRITMGRKSQTFTSHSDVDFATQTTGTRTIAMTRDEARSRLALCLRTGWTIAGECVA